MPATLTVQGDQSLHALAYLGPLISKHFSYFLLFRLF
jgi:hypothetical protein